MININNMKEINNLENKYGLVVFRMGLTHLVDVGVRHLTNENIEDCIKQIMAHGENEKVSGITSIMTPEFQCEVV